MGDVTMADCCRYIRHFGGLALYRDEQLPHDVVVGLDANREVVPKSSPEKVRGLIMHPLVLDALLEAIELEALL